MGEILGSYFSFHNFMLLFCVKSWIYLFCVKYLLHNKSMCPFDYEIVHKNVHFLVSNPCKTKFLDMCDELLSECSLPKDQVLGTWVLV